jgi:hypothetical protein
MYWYVCCPPPPTGHEHVILSRHLPEVTTECGVWLNPCGSGYDPLGSDQC